MSTGSAVALVILVLAFALLIVESIAEAGVIGLSRSRARLLHSREPDNQAATRLVRIILDRERTQGSFSVGRTLAVVTSMGAALYVVIQEFEFSWSAVLITGIVAFLLVGLVQSVPRRLATIRPEGFGLRFARLMDALDSLFVIPAVLMEAPARLASRFSAVAQEHEPDPDDLEVRLEQEDGGGIEEEEREIIRRVFEIGETTVREAMIPRPDIVSVPLDTPLTEAAKVCVDRGFSRIPVYEGSIDNIIGVLYAKDTLAELLAGRDTSLREIMRQPLLVPGSKRIDELLTELRTSRVHIAIVLDEYGGTAGLVTIEDLIEEIVGEIEDEYDPYGGAQIIRISDDEVIMDGRTSTDCLDDLFGYRLEDEEFDTIGGFIFDRLGKIPEPGDEVEVASIHLSVLRMQGRRIDRVRARRRPESQAADAPASQERGA